MVHLYWTSWIGATNHEYVYPAFLPSGRKTLKDRLTETRKNRGNMGETNP